MQNINKTAGRRWAKAFTMLNPKIDALKIKTLYQTFKKSNSSKPDTKILPLRLIKPVTHKLVENYYKKPSNILKEIITRKRRQGPSAAAAILKSRELASSGQRRSFIDEPLPDIRMTSFVLNLLKNRRMLPTELNIKKILIARFERRRALYEKLAQRRGDEQGVKSLTDLKEEAIALSARLNVNHQYSPQYRRATETEANSKALFNGVDHSKYFADKWYLPFRIEFNKGNKKLMSRYIPSRNGIPTWTVNNPTYKGLPNDSDKYVYGFKDVQLFLQAFLRGLPIFFSGYPQVALDYKSKYPEAGSYLIRLNTENLRDINGTLPLFTRHYTGTGRGDRKYWKRNDYEQAPGGGKWGNYPKYLTVIVRKSTNPARYIKLIMSYEPKVYEVVDGALYLLPDIRRIRDLSKLRSSGFDRWILRSKLAGIDFD